MQFELGTMLFHLAAFFLLVALVSKFAFRPIVAMMKKRQDHIQNQMTTAEGNRLESEKFLQQQKDLLDQARLEAKEMIERAKRQKEREAEEIINQAKIRANQLVEDAAKEIQLEKEQAISQLRDQVGLLSVQLTSKLLEKEVRNAEQSELVDRYLEQVGRVQ